MIPLKYQVIILAAAILLAGGVGYTKGKESGLEKYYTFKSSVEAESQRLREENAKREGEWAVAIRQAMDGWNTALAELERRPRIVRVRDTCGGAGTMPGLSPTATKVEGLQAGESGLGTARTLTVEECEARVNGSIADAVWIETVKQLTDEWHEKSK